MGVEWGEVATGAGYIWTQPRQEALHGPSRGDSSDSSARHRQAHGYEGHGGPWEGHDEDEDEDEMSNAPRKFVRSQNEL